MLCRFFPVALPPYVVKVGSRFFEEHFRTVSQVRKVLHVPVDALQVVLPAEELQFFEGFLAGKVALHGRMHLFEEVGDWWIPIFFSSLSQGGVIPSRTYTEQWCQFFAVL